MAILEVLEHPNPILKQKAVKVEAVNDDVRALLDDMLETMYASFGVGLAAPQIGVLKRIVVIDIAFEGQKPEPMFLINPEIIETSEETVICEEGCLSVPEQRADVERFDSVKVKYLDYNGKECELFADDFLAIAMQHELDHLDGVLYIDRLSRVKRNMLLKKLSNLRKG